MIRYPAELDDSLFPAELERHARAAVRRIPEGRIHLFCASCAERFDAGYQRWLTEERLLTPPAGELPPAEFVRDALDACWRGDKAAADSLRRSLIEMMPGEDEQPIFKSPMSDYFEVLWLVKLGLSALVDPQLTFGLTASAIALDFFNQLLDRRREQANVGPAFDDPARDIREYAVDPGALAESAIQVEDAEELSKGQPDLTAMRQRSADYGGRLLEQVLTFIRPPQPPATA